MRKLAMFLLPALWAVAGCIGAHAQSAASPVLVKAARLLDPRSGNLLAPAAVLVEGNTIKRVGPDALLDVSPGTRIVDLGSATLLPGLIDAHTHLLLDVVVPPEPEIARRGNGKFAPGLLLAIVESPTKRALMGARLAREDLESGITTVRNLGHSGIDGDTALRDAINAGRVAGPRILASGRKLITRGSYVQELNPVLADAILQQEFLVIDGVDRAREAVRRNEFQAVDLIKVTADENLTVAELASVVEEAHRAHLKVAVHAADTRSIQTAIDAGADSIEHGDDATDAQLQAMRDKGIFLDLTPTFYAGFFTRIQEPSIVMSAAMRSTAAARDARHRQRYDQLVQRVLKSGVRLSAGSDMCWFYPGKTRGQASIEALVKLHDAGIPALDVIRAITVDAAAMLGWPDRVGALEPGKFADLIAVAGDPVADIHELEHAVFVMKDGAVIRNDVASSPASAGIAPPPRVVQIKASDGVALEATYFAAGKPGPGVLLLHQVNRTRKSWDPVASRLAAAGINVLTLDMRGIGGSGGPRWDKLTRDERKRLPDDVDAALAFLVSQPGVDRGVVGVGGAGWLGVMYAVEAARRHPREVKSLVLMSGEARDGLRFLHEASQLPELFVFSDDDEYPPTQDAMKLLYATASSPARKLVHYAAAADAPWLGYETFDASRVPAHGGHGTDMFDAHPELHGIVVGWLVTTLIRTPGHAPADALAAAPLLNRLQVAGGVAEARQQLLAARERDPQAQLWPEPAADLIGEGFQDAGKIKDAIEVFELNLLAYPDSADAHSNLADAYLADGRKDLAREHATKALALLDSRKSPASSWSDTDARREEIRRSARKTLEQASGGH
jgi:imidazolonepropionase-like amidohydrolase/dienelactone hydrolase